MILLNKRQCGFSMVELLIAVAIIGIISAIAYPSYQNYVIKAKRADGMGALLNASSAMERFGAARNTYATAAVGTTFVQDVPANDPYYRLSLSNLGRSTYTITATPINSMAGRDGALTITHAGVKTWTDKNGNLYNCWPESGNSC